MLMSPSDRPAKLHFQPNGYRVLSPGNHVLCAISGAAVGLDGLRYWSVERQEAYAGPVEATRALAQASSTGVSS